MAGTATQTIKSVAGCGLGRLFDAFRSFAMPRQRQQPTASARSRDIQCGGLKPGGAAPDFSLPRVGGGECSLSNYAGRRVLLVFMQGGCQASPDVAPELNRLQRSGEVQVLVINHCRPHEAGLWADDVLAAFPVLVPAGRDVADAYEACATPFAFVIDERGRIASSGFIDSPRSLAGVIDAAAFRTLEGQSSRCRLLPRLRRAG
jgi:peroxiredoxin